MDVMQEYDCEHYDAGALNAILDAGAILDAFCFFVVWAYIF